MVLFSIMLHCDLSIRLVSGALRASVLRASCFFGYATVDVLSPKATSSFVGIILPGMRVRLCNGTFS